MSRSVSVPAGAYVAYTSVDCIEDFDEWEDFEAELRLRIKRLCPSMVPSKAWIGREDITLARNDFAYFGVSAYGGLAAVWLLPRTDTATPGLAEAWVNRVYPKFHHEFATLVHIATASNGEAFFRKIEEAQ